VSLYNFSSIDFLSKERTSSDFGIFNDHTKEIFDPSFSSYGSKAIVKNAAGSHIQGWYFLIANLQDGVEIDTSTGNYSNTQAFE